jgi:hypothetical protein
MACKWHVPWHTPSSNEEAARQEMGRTGVLYFIYRKTDPSNLICKSLSRRRRRRRRRRRCFQLVQYSNSW